MAKEIVRKRVTLHPLKEDGTIDTSINLYPKTFIDGIVDKDGEQVEVQEKLTAGENITIEDNVISAIVETVDAYTKEESDAKFATIDYVDNNKGTKLYKYNGCLSTDSSRPDGYVYYTFISNIYYDNLQTLQYKGKDLTLEIANDLVNLSHNDLSYGKMTFTPVSYPNTVLGEALYQKYEVFYGAYIKVTTYKITFNTDGTFTTDETENTYEFGKNVYLFNATITELQ